MLESPLDKLEPYSIFKTTLLSNLRPRFCSNGLSNALIELQTDQPQLYESLTRHLTEPDQAVLRNVVARAEAIERDTAAAAAATTLTTNGGPH